MADLFGEKVINVPVEDEITKSYLDYSMSVIVGRALPDIRDGLKPVHRRILFAMNEMGCLPNKPYKKSARVVGEVLGKFHPHGDIALYDALVRMAQPFSLRYPLIDGHGNFGSIDGDAPAAMRYTEARLSKISMELLDGLNEDAVDFLPNFDNTLKEPVVLPAKFPNLLANGSSGIAVGMATNIPPHNLTELIDALVYVIENEKIANKKAETEELFQFIKGPDFPTAGTIVGKSGIREYFATGRGTITIRGKAHIEKLKKSKKFHFVITELPYEVNKANLVEKIADLVRAKRLTGVEDIRDESDKDGIRIVIRLNQSVNVNVFEKKLRLATNFEKRYGVILLGILNNIPKVFTMKELLDEFLKFRNQVVIRIANYQLKKAEKYLEILLGLKAAIEHIDEVIKIIRGSKDAQVAASKLKLLLNISDDQVKAILDMKLSRLTGLEHEKLLSDIESTKAKISELEKVLNNDIYRWNKIKEDLIRIKGKYGDKRKTEITNEEGKIEVEDLIADKPVIVSMTKEGYIKIMPVDTFKVQNRGGKGIIGQPSSKDDVLLNMFTTTTKSKVLFFTNKGKVYSLKVYEIPESRRESKGTSIYRLLRLDSNEFVTAAIPLLLNNKIKHLLFVTKHGKGKRVAMEQFKSVMKSGKIAIRLTDDDELVSIVPLNNNEEYVIITSHGLGIRSSSTEIRAMGRSAMGVRLTRLGIDDYVIGAVSLHPDKNLFIITEKGYGKQIRWGEVRKIKRGGKGVKCIRIDEKTGKVKAILLVKENDEIIIFTKDGNAIKISAKDVSTYSRYARGVKVVRFKSPNDSVASVDTISYRDEREI